MTTKAIKDRLEYLRREIEAERISLKEVAELESLAEHIDKDDVFLLEWAAIPETPEEIEHTPTPWLHIHNRSIHLCKELTVSIQGVNEHPICNVEGLANAKHIVKCVNMHDELLEALKASHNHALWVVEALNNGMDPDLVIAESANHRDAMKEILAKAEA